VKRKWKERYKQKFRRRAVARMNACESIRRLSRELGVSRGLLYTWGYRLEPPDAQVEGTVSTQNSLEYSTSCCSFRPTTKIMLRT
jgi:transposase-like protein